MGFTLTVMPIYLVLQHLNLENRVNQQLLILLSFLAFAELKACPLNNINLEKLERTTYSHLKLIHFTKWYRLFFKYSLVFLLIFIIHFRLLNIHHLSNFHHFNFILYFNLIMINLLLQKLPSFPSDFLLFQIKNDECFFSSYV